MRNLAALLLTLAVALPLGATAQIPDQIRIGDKTYPLHATPLLQEHVERLPRGGVVGTALWRGYIASWAVRGNHFFLEDIRIPTKSYRDHEAPESKRFQSGMKSVFGDGSPRIATWYTGHLVIPTGEIENYVHMGFASTYSSYIVATVVQGSVRELREMDAKQFDAFRRRQFAEWKKTPAYAAARAQVTNVENPDEFLFQFASGAYESIIFPKRK